MVDVLLYLYDGVKEYNFDPDYLNYFFYIIDNYVAVGVDDINLTAPIRPHQLAGVLNRLGYSNELIKVVPDNHNSVIKKMIKSINNNKPVIINEMDIKSFITNEKNKTEGNTDREFFLYQNLKAYGNGLEAVNPSDRMTVHYVTVTGIIKDKYSGNIFLKVQSWGEIYYILYNDFVNCNSGTFDIKSSAILID